MRKFRSPVHFTAAVLPCIDVPGGLYAIKNLVSTLCNCNNSMRAVYTVYLLVMAWNARTPPADLESIQKCAADVCVLQYSVVIVEVIPNHE